MSNHVSEERVTGNVEGTPRPWREKLYPMITLVVKIQFSLKEATGIPYSREYWRSLNLEVLSQTMFFTLLADLNLAVWYGIAIRTCTRKKILVIFNLAVERHTTKPPNFLAIQ